MTRRPRLLLLLPALALVLSACGGDDGDEQFDFSGGGSSDDAKPYVDAMAASLAEGKDSPMDQEQASCFSEGFVDVIGVDRLKSIGSAKEWAEESEGLEFTGSSSPRRRAARSTTTSPRARVDLRESLLADFADDDSMDEKTKQCVADAMDEENLREFFVTIMVEGDGGHGRSTRAALFGELDVLRMSGMGGLRAARPPSPTRSSRRRPLRGCAPCRTGAPRWPVTSAPPTSRPASPTTPSPSPGAAGARRARRATRPRPASGDAGRVAAGDPDPAVPAPDARSPPRRPSGPCPGLVDRLARRGRAASSRVGEVAARLDVRPYATDDGDLWVVSDLTPGPRRQPEPGRRRPRARHQPGLDLAGPAHRARAGRPRARPRHRLRRPGAAPGRGTAARRGRHRRQPARAAGSTRLNAALNERRRPRRRPRRLASSSRWPASAST